MEKIRIGEITEVTRGRLLSGNADARVAGVTVDSRNAEEHVLFFALTGGARDGHEFLKDAYEHGCRDFVISDPDKAAGLSDADVILVRDTQDALEDLAHHYLAGLDIRKAAVTGSVGKTSTRDMLYYILSTKYKTVRPEKNYNNEIGIPLTIFGLDRSCEAVVFEEGLAGPGDIHRLTRITRPNSVCVTNVGVSHLEHFDSREDLKRAKLEIADFLKPDGTLVLNTDCDILSKNDVDAAYRVISCGTQGDEDYVVSGVQDKGPEGVSFDITAEGKTVHFDLPVAGAHNALNCAVAAATAAPLGVGLEDAAKGLEKLKLTGKRLLMKEGNGIRVIDDSYNAAPDSMKSAIDTLMNTGGKRRIAVLGGMNELGEGSRDAHLEVGRYAAAEHVDVVIGIGDKARAIVEGAMEEGGCFASWYPDKDSFYRDLESRVTRGDAVLVKASNAYAMSEVADRITGQRGE